MERPLTSCPVCGGELFATVACYLRRVTLDAEARVTGWQPAGESVRECLDFDPANGVVDVYCDEGCYQWPLRENGL